MYLYNISIIIEESVHHELLEWTKSQWLPTLAESTKFLEMLYSPHEGFTYCVQFITSTEEEINTFKDTQLIKLQNHIGEHFMGKAFIFDSTMKYIVY